MTRKKESGQALVFGVVVLGIVLMGFAGLGIDIGVMRYEKRLLQTAADGAAIAGADDLRFVGSSYVSTAAGNAVAANGFSGATIQSSADCPTTVTQLTVTVNNPPKTGPHAVSGTPANYVEVCVAQLVPTYFMRVMNISNRTVSARAVATNLGGGGTTSGCLFTLGAPSSGIGVNVQGSAAIQAPTCGIVDDGNFDTTGKAFDVCAASFAVVGTAGSTGTQGACGGKGLYCTASSTCPATSTPPAGDPLAYLTAPSQPAASTNCPAKGACNVTTAGTSTLQPGTYNTITFGKNSVTTLASGLYYIDGSPGIIFKGGGTVQGTDVTVYFTNGATINATGGGNNLDIQLSAPTTGTYAGVLFYQDRSDTSAPSLGGDNNTSFTGALYFPSADLTFFGNANLNANSAYSIVVAQSLSTSGNPTLYLNSDYSGLPGGVSIIKNAILVE